MEIRGFPEFLYLVYPNEDNGCLEHYLDCEPPESKPNNRKYIRADIAERQLAEWKEAHAGLERQLSTANDMVELYHGKWMALREAVKKAISYVDGYDLTDVYYVGTIIGILQAALGDTE